MTLYADIPGERLDAFLARAVENLSRSGAQKLLEEGCVLVNGKAAKKNHKLTPGEEISVTIPEPKAVDIAPKEMALDIVYEDEDLVIIDKAANMIKDMARCAVKVNVCYPFEVVVEIRQEE